VCPSSLDHEEHLLLPLWSFQGARELERPQIPPNKDGLSKLNSVTFTELDIVLGTRVPDGKQAAIDGSSTYRSNRSGIPRKEVIQPQLPLRLPCYDFTPIINPTFDGSLPCGLGHRLRVLPTFVV
jgi:hypothetical protein